MVTKVVGCTSHEETKRSLFGFGKVVGHGISELHLYSESGNKSNIASEKQLFSHESKASVSAKIVDSLVSLTDYRQSDLIIIYTVDHETAYFLTSLFLEVSPSININVVNLSTKLNEPLDPSKVTAKEVAEFGAAYRDLLTAGSLYQVVDIYGAVAREPNSLMIG